MTHGRILNAADSVCYLAAFPTRASVEKLQEIFMSSPLAVHWNFIHVPLWAGPRADAPPVMDGLLTGTPRSLEILMDPLTSNFELASKLSSSDLATELVRVGHDTDYPLRLTFQSHAPGLTMANKFFITSVSDGLAAHGPTIVFEEDLVMMNPEFDLRDHKSLPFLSVR